MSGSATATQGPMPSGFFPLLVSDPKESVQANIVICATLTWAVACFFVGLRCYTRERILRIFGPTDWALLCSLLFSATQSTLYVVATTYGTGRHLLDNPPSNSITSRFLAWVVIMPYTLALMCTKISILLLYSSILVFQQARYAAYFLLVFVILQAVWSVVLIFTAVIPLHAFWDFETIPTFVQPFQNWEANTGTHIGTDFLIFLLPMPVIFTLRVPWKQKLLTYSLFALGFLFLALLAQATAPDTTFAVVDLIYWSCIEVNAAITCACIMTLKPLMMRIFPRWIGSVPNSWLRASEVERDGEPDYPQPLTVGSRPLRKMRPIITLTQNSKDEEFSIQSRRFSKGTDVEWELERKTPNYTVTDLSDIHIPTSPLALPRAHFRDPFDDEPEPPKTPTRTKRKLSTQPSSSTFYIDASDED